MNGYSTTRTLGKGQLQACDYSVCIGVIFCNCLELCFSILIGMCLKDTESTTGQVVGSKSKLKISENKKPQVKAMKNLPADNKNGLDSDSGVSMTDESNKPSITNSASSRKKKFLKTAKLLRQVGQTVEEYEDSVATEDGGGKRQEKSTAIKDVAVKKKLVNQVTLDSQEKRVTQVKRGSQEKLVNRPHDCEHKDEGGAIMKSRVVNGNGGKRNVANSVRIASEEGRSDDDDADVEEETCTEEDEERSHEENEPKAEKQQRTKLVKKVRVRPS